MCVCVVPCVHVTNQGLCVRGGLDKSATAQSSFTSQTSYSTFHVQMNIRECLYIVHCKISNIIWIYIYIIFPNILYNTCIFTWSYIILFINLLIFKYESKWTRSASFLLAYKEYWKWAKTLLWSSTNINFPFGHTHKSTYTSFPFFIISVKIGWNPKGGNGAGKITKF